MKSRLLVTGVFVLLAAATGKEAVDAWLEAASLDSLHGWAVALYAVLKLGIVLAFSVFVFTRDPARRPSRDPVAFAACAAAVGAVVLLHRPGPSADTGLVLFGELIAVAACAWLLVAVLALGRCFGVLPEVRGLVTRGPYRFVRHPVYLGELGACAGLVVAAPSLWNLGVAAVFFARTGDPHAPGGARTRRGVSGIRDLRGGDAAHRAAPPAPPEAWAARDRSGPMMRATRPRARAVLALLLAAAVAGLLAEPAVAQTIVPGGTPLTVTTTSAGENASVVFDGVSGQRVSLEITDVTIGTSTCCSTRVSILRPDGRSMTSVTVGTNGGFLDATTLPSAGTYSIVVDPQSTNVGSATLTLHDVPPDVTDAIAAGGPPVAVTTTAPGQNALVTFAGTAGERVSVQIADVTMGTSTCCSVRVSILRPDGKTLVAPLSVGTTGGFLDATTLPSTGTYTILVDPQGTSTGGASLVLGDVPPDATASLAVGEPATLSTAVPGQNAAVTFTGSAGQRVSLEITGVTIGTSLCCSTKVSILRPDGRVLVAPVFVGTNGGFLDATSLPSVGTYTVIVDPQGPDTGGATLMLYDVPADAGGSVVAGGAPAGVTTTVPGQNAVLTFGGTSGQRVSAVVDDVSVGTSSCCSVRLSLLRPNGSVLVGPVNAGTAGGFLDAVVLPQSGTYTIVVDPQGAATGSARVTLHDVPPDALGALTVGIPRTLITVVPGQNGQGTFSGVSGQVVSVRIGPACCSARVTLLKPNGTTLASTTTFATGGGFLDAVVLPQSGTYTVLVDYQGPATGDVTLTLHDVPADVIEPVAFGSSVTVTTGVPGQNARVTFAGTVGGRASVRIAPICCLAQVSVIRPDARTLVAPMLVGTFGGFVDAVDLPLSGTYTILVDYQGPATGSATVSLHDVPADVADTIAFGSTKTIATTVPGQNARVTFGGSAGQRAAVRVSGSCCTMRVSILRPDGSTLSSLTSFASIDGFLEPVALPTTGTYTIVLDPDGAGTGSSTISLYDVPPDVTDTIAPGAPLRVTIATPGQNARVVFGGTSGQEVSLRMTDVTLGSILSGTTVSLLRPDGIAIASTNVGTNGGFLDGRTLPVTGTYAVVVNPHGANTGGLTLTLEEVPSDVSDTIVAGGSPVTVTTSVPGQDARVTFTGTAGRRVSLKVGPSCCVGRVSITSPGGATLASTTTFGTFGIFVDATTLPESGTYTILVDYDGSSTGAVTLTLYDVPDDLTGTIVAGGPTVDVATTVPGQNASITFTGTIGRRVSLRVGPSCCIGRVSIVRPSGLTLVAPTVFGAGGTFVDATELPESGTYTVVVDWDGASTGSVTLALHDVPPDATATAVLGGPAVTVTPTVPGQNGRVTFTASAGDGVRLVTGPFNCCSIRLSILAPDGTTVGGPTGFNPDGGTMDVHLAQSGTHTVLVDPQGPNSGGVSVRLEVDNTAPAPPLLSLAESSPDSHAVATTFFYRPAGGGGIFTVGAVASDGGTGLDRVTFPGLAGGFSPTSPFDDRIPPYGQTYSWTTGAAYAGQTNLVTAYDRVGNSSATAFSVVPDPAAPTTSDNTAAIGSAWKNTTQIVVLSPSDGTGAGSQRTHYTTDGSDPTGVSPQGTTVTLAAEGLYTLKYFSVDNVGNIEAVRTAGTQVRIDKTPPSGATLDPLPTVIRNGQALTGAGTDALSGVASISYHFCPGGSCTPSTLVGSSSTGPDYRVVWSSQPADGVYQVLARVRDAAGNTTDSAKRTVTIDNTAPQTTIVSAPANPTNATSAGFSFTASEGGATFQCRLDGGAWTTCSSPRSYNGLGEGAHVFEARATDPVGNTDATPATHAWVVDLTAPQTAIVSAPATPTNATSASFSFTSTESGSTFECRLDGGAWTGCTSARSYGGLADGSHGFEVRATDAAGNTDGSAASYAWVVDTSAPDTTITSAPGSPTSSTSAGFSFTASEGGATFECRLDGGAWGACASPTGFGGLGEGMHVFQVRALDGIGNADATPAMHTWTVDVTAPQTTITTAPADPTNATSASLSFAASELGSTFDCRLNGGAWAPCSSPAVYAGLGEGPAHRRGARDRSRGKHGRDTGDGELGRRHLGAGDCHHGVADRSDQRYNGELLVHVHGERLHVRMPARRRRLGIVRRAENLHRPRRGFAHVRGAGNRPGREHRSPSGGAYVDDRPDRAGHDDHGDARRCVEIHGRELLVRGKRARLELRVPPRRQPVGRLYEPHDALGPRGGQPHVRSSRDRRRGERRPEPGRVLLGGRSHAARDVDHLGAPEPGQPDVGDLPLHGRRKRIGLRVPSGRQRLGALHEPAGLHRSRRRRPRLRGTCDGHRRERRRDSSDACVDRRHDAARAPGDREPGRGEHQCDRHRDALGDGRARSARRDPRGRDLAGDDDDQRRRRLEPDAHERRRRIAHVHRQGERRGGQHLGCLERPHRRRRHDGAQHGSHDGAARRDPEHLGQLHVRRRRPCCDLRVPPRRRRLGWVLEPTELCRARRGLPHVRRAGDRRGWEHGSHVGHQDVDGGHDAPGLARDHESRGRHDERLRSTGLGRNGRARVDRGALRRRHVQGRHDRDVRRHLEQAPDLARRRLAHLHRRGDGRRRQHFERLERTHGRGRHERAGHVDRVRPVGSDRGDHRDVRLDRERAGRRVRVPPRRRCLGGLLEPRDVRRPRRGDARLRGARRRRGREHRCVAGRMDLGHRPDGAGELDRLEPDGPDDRAGRHLHLQRGRPFGNVRVPPGQRYVGGVREPGDLDRPRAGRARLRGPGAGRGRKRRPHTGRARVDGDMTRARAQPDEEGSR